MQDNPSAKIALGATTCTGSGGKESRTFDEATQIADTSTAVSTSISSNSTNREGSASPSCGLTGLTIDPAAMCRPSAIAEEQLTDDANLGVELSTPCTVGDENARKETLLITLPRSLPHSLGGDGRVDKPADNAMSDIKDQPQAPETLLDFQQVRSRCATALAQMSTVAQQLVKLQAQLDQMQVSVGVHATASATEDVQHQMRAMQADILQVSQLLDTSNRTADVGASCMVAEGHEQPVRKPKDELRLVSEKQQDGLEVLLQPLLEGYKARYAEQLGAQLMAVIQSQTKLSSGHEHDE